MFIATLIALFFGPAIAQGDLASGLSQDVVEITSTYTGTDLVVFGAVERPQRGETGDIAVVVRGPDARMTVRRKDRIVGLWINGSSARLSGMAAYYFLAATRPLADIAAPETLKRYGLGFDTLVPRRAVGDGPQHTYRAALIRMMERKGFYTEKSRGVELLSGPTLFRVHVPLPAAAPRGEYTVQVYLFRRGQLVGVRSTPLFVDQIGFERRVNAFAHHWPLLYGLAAVLMAVLIGWASSLLFRRNG
jgi:uncharacterized protein (TIGR02186 family)